MKKSKLTHAYLLKRISYSPLTGIFRWTYDPLNNRFAGKIAGSRSQQGTGIVIQLHGEKWTASRLAMFFMNGELPKGRIQHKNKNPYDCRYENLQEVG